MNVMNWRSCLAAAFLIAVLTGCNRDDARVYHVPKDDSSRDQASPPPAPVPPDAPTSTPIMAAPPGDAAARPQIAYNLPEGWKEKSPGDMRVASFAAPGPNGQSADISVIPLPIVGHDLELVNMWRSKVQLPATSDPDAVKQSVPVAIGTEQGQMFEFVSDQPMTGKSRERFFVARLTRGSMSWFFKITGEDEFITSQKSKFLQFLKSVSFVEDGAAPAEPAVATQAATSPSIWAIPAGWQAQPPSQFLLAEFAVTGDKGAKATVNVAVMGGDGGGPLANINRWRAQLGLAETEEKDLPQQARLLDLPGNPATLVDFTGVNAKTGTATRLVGAIVPQNGQTWFYKLMGDDPLVTQQKDAFIAFIKSANYANAHLPGN